MENGVPPPPPANGNPAVADGTPAEGVPQKPVASIKTLRQQTKIWSLSSDTELMGYLQEFSSKLMAKTHHMEGEVFDLVSQALSVDVKLHNTFNEFLMLADTQFIENRVFADFSHIKQTGDGDEGKEEKEALANNSGEAALLPKFKEAINLGVLLVREPPKPETTKKEGSEESDPFKSDGDAVDDAPAIPNRYSARPLPYLIGTQDFMDDETCGLVNDIALESESVTEDRVPGEISEVSSDTSSSYDDEELSSTSTPTPSTSSVGLSESYSYSYTPYSYTESKGSGASSSDGGVLKITDGKKGRRESKAGKKKAVGNAGSAPPPPPTADDPFGTGAGGDLFGPVPSAPVAPQTSDTSDDGEPKNSKKKGKFNADDDLFGSNVADPFASAGGDDALFAEPGRKGGAKDAEEALFGAPAKDKGGRKRGQKKGAKESAPTEDDLFGSSTKKKTGLTADPFGGGEDDLFGEVPKPKKARGRKGAKTTKAEDVLPAPATSGPPPPDAVMFAESDPDSESASSEKKVAAPKVSKKEDIKPELDPADPGKIFDDSDDLFGAPTKKDTKAEKRDTKIKKKGLAADPFASDSDDSFAAKTKEKKKTTKGDKTEDAVNQAGMDEEADRLFGNVQNKARKSRKSKKEDKPSNTDDFLFGDLGDDFASKVGQQKKGTRVVKDDPFASEDDDDLFGSNSKGKRRGAQKSAKDGGKDDGTKAVRKGRANSKAGKMGAALGLDAAMFDPSKAQPRLSKAKQAVLSDSDSDMAEKKKVLPAANESGGDLEDEETSAPSKPLSSTTKERPRMAGRRPPTRKGRMVAGDGTKDDTTTDDVPKTKPPARSKPALADDDVFGDDPFADPKPMANGDKKKEKAQLDEDDLFGGLEGDAPKKRAPPRRSAKKSAKPSMEDDLFGGLDNAAPKERRKPAKPKGRKPPKEEGSIFD